MRFLIPLEMLGAAVAIAFLAGCSGGSAIAPKPVLPQGGDSFFSTRIGQHYVSHYSCPATGPIKYVSENANNVVDVFVGKFAGQAPCGQITSGLLSPWGLYVKANTHDLYVANEGGSDILVFHRGQMAPYNTYTDPTLQYPTDVTVAKDGTVIASNIMGYPESSGSLSTWIGGPNGGKFVGNFPMTNSFRGGYVTVQKNGTVFFDDIDLSTNDVALWSVSCPSGACGAQTKVAALSHDTPGGLGSDATDDLIVIESSLKNHGIADTFELPNPKPKTFPLQGTTWGMAINDLDNHLFVTDVKDDGAAEYLYPSGTFVGFVQTGQHGYPFGIAVDP